MHIDELAIGYDGQKDLDCIRDVSYIGTLYISDSDIRDISALEGREDITLLYTYTSKPPALRVVPHPALALDNKTSNAIISVGPKPHYK